MGEAINQMSIEKAPDLHGFTGAFFKKCCPTIKNDIMQVILCFDNLYSSNLKWRNSANIVLIPKNEWVEGISDYRPISLIHAIAKIIAKVPAMRLGPHMHSLISNVQNDFIKR